MPIKSLICRGCGGREVPLDHFHETRCGETVCSPRYVNAVLAHEREHYSAAQEEPTVTTILSCPRSWRIRKTENYPVDPTSVNAALTGTAYHESLSRHSAPGTVVERPVSGTIRGVRLTGRPDCLTPAKRLIEDDKHKSDWSEKQVRAEGAAPEHIAQLVLYAELTEQTERWRPERGIIWYHWSTNGGLLPIEILYAQICEIPLPDTDQTMCVGKSISQLPPLKWALEFKPHGGQYTVAELLEQTRETDWRRMPLAGESQLFGGKKSMCEYCPVKNICFTEAKGVAF